MSMCRIRLTPESVAPRRRGHRDKKAFSVPRCLGVSSSITGSSKTTAGYRRDFVDFLPLYARRGQHDALRQPVTPADLNVGAGEIQHLNHHLVRRSAIIGIDDADAVGDHQSALERRAASGKNRQAMAGGYLDNEAGAN